MSGNPILSTHNLAIGYARRRQPDIELARALSLSVRRAELVCLLGPNGVGKSTLMRTLAGMHKPLAGQVFLDGDDVHCLKPTALARRLGIVLTDRPNLGLLNGYALVALGRHPHTGWLGRLSHYDQAMIRWAVDAVDSAGLADRPVMELSDGQRQKLLIARALAQAPDVILLDEPTAFLDLPRRVEVMRLLRYLARETGRAILLSTHDLDLALRAADTVWLMSGGSVLAGTPEDLVLSGAFEEAFAGQGVAFDRQSGSFSISETARATVALQGEGILYAWTDRALKRAGFAVVSNGTMPSATIRVEGDESAPLWRLYAAGQQVVCHTLSELLTALGQQNLAADHV